VADESFKDVVRSAEESVMSEPFGDSRDLTRPEDTQANAVFPWESSEVPWHVDPSVSQGQVRSSLGDARAQAGYSSHIAATNGRFAGVRTRAGLRETGPGLDMTEHAEIVDGLAADRYVVVLRSGQPTIVQLDRASAIEQGFTVVDPDQSMLATLLAAQETSVVPLDVTAGPPLRDLRSVEGSHLGEADIVDEVKAEMSVPVRPEVVEPVLTSAPAMIAEAPVDLPIGNRVIDDAPPAIRRGRPWSSEARPMPEADPVGQPRSAAPPLPEEVVVPVAQRDVPPSVVRALDDLDDDAMIAIPQWDVIETTVESPGTLDIDEPDTRVATQDVERSEAVVTDVTDVVDADPHNAMPVSVLPWQEPVWGASTPVPQTLVPSPSETGLPETSPQPAATADVHVPSAIDTTEVAPALEVPGPEAPGPEAQSPEVPSRTPVLQSVPAVPANDDGVHQQTSKPDRVGADRNGADRNGADRDDADSAVPAISITGLVRSYVGPLGPVPVLKGVDLDLAPGDLLVLRGASGSGLTTLLNCAAGLDVPDGGQVYVNGEEMGAWSEADRARFRAASAGFVPQTQELVDDLNARDNVLLPLLAAGWGTAPARREAERLLEAFGILDRTFFYPSQMSHSERLRTAVARALAGDPFLVWADDPTCGLDEINAQLVVDALVAHHHRGATVVIASRDRRFLSGTARVADLVDGVVQPMDAVATLTWNN
jgi:ABC-type lipoprotein export system ATPase subunit